MYQGIKVMLALMMLAGAAAAIDCNLDYKYYISPIQEGGTPAGYFNIGSIRGVGTNLAKTGVYGCYCQDGSTSGGYTNFNCPTLTNPFVPDTNWTCDDKTSAFKRNGTDIIGGSWMHAHIPENHYRYQIVLIVNDSYSNTYTDTLSLVGKTVLSVSDADFTPEYNITFRTEEENRDYVFTAHGSTSKMEIVCPTLKTSNSVSLTAANNIIRTYEPPIILVKTDSDLQRRDRIMTTSSSYNQVFYLLNQTKGQIYTFNLVDYTARYGAGIFEVTKTINGENKVVFDNFFDTSRNAYVSLRNNTAYGFRVYTREGSVRDFGTMSLLPSDTTKSIEITGVDLTTGINRFEGNLTTSLTKDFDSRTITLNYAKTTGKINSVNMTVYDMNETPYLLKQSQYVNYTTSGQLVYSVPDENHTYYVYTKFNNNGMVIERTSVVWLTNQTKRLLDLNFPSTVMGVSDTSVYKGLAGMIIVVTLLGFGAVDVGMGLMICSVEIIALNYLWSPDVDIPEFIVVVCLVLAALSYIGQRRNITE